MSKTISILGATGSIGRQTLDVAEQLGLTVAALTAHSSVERLEAQARKFRPRLAILTDEAAARDLAVRLADTDTKVLGGPEALLEAAVCPEADTVVTAVVGMVGLKPTLAAIREKKRIALANKETLVCAGQLVMDAADTYGAEIVPVDSEHSAIFQCLQGCADRGEIRRLILTCSGGPFYGMTAEEVGKMTRGGQNDQSGRPPPPQLDHGPQDHRGLRYSDEQGPGGHRGHAALPPAPGAGVGGDPPAEHRPLPGGVSGRGHPGPAGHAGHAAAHPLRHDLAEPGGTACAILNGANEEAVGLFLAEKIGFSDIPRLVAEARAAVAVQQAPSLEDILAADQAARQAVLARA